MQVQSHAEMRGWAGDRDAMNRSNANTQHAHGLTNPMLLFSFSIMYIVLGNRQSVYCEHHNYIYIYIYHQDVNVLNYVYNAMYS